MINQCWKSILCGLLLSLLNSCGSAGIQSISPTIEHSSGFEQLMPTKENLVASITAEVVNDRAIIQTMQTLPTLNPTRSANSYEAPPTSVLPTGIIAGEDCESEDGDPTFITANCWRTYLRDGLIYINISAGRQYPDTPGSIELYVSRNNEFFSHHRLFFTAPQITSQLSLTAVNYPLVDIQSESGFRFRFNIQTRQWLDTAGGPIPITLTATQTFEPTIAIPPLQTGMGVLSLSLLDATTNLPIAGFEQMNGPTSLELSRLGVDNFNLRANTSPETVGSVQFLLDGELYRIDNTPPYTLNAENEHWLPNEQKHELRVTTYSGPNATGKRGGWLVLWLSASGFPLTEALLAPSTATIPAKITPVAATPTSN
ncbi:hypothetical protein Hgul01_00340 [Herpetosiphon gulosus]|uniref:Lipoprotein n=2 Tax=Herpetosiphon gulosus TaxID=1973496 RepID=A0ABP9WTN8_9CHLR